MNLFSLFAVLLIVTQAPVPVSRQTPNGSTHAYSKPEDKAYNEKPPSTTTLAVAISKKDDTPDLKTNGNEGTNTHPPQVDVGVVKMPRRDRFDWITWGGGMLLTIVGIGGIVVAIVTLCFIKRQAIEMRRQRITMEKTLNAIRQQANHMERQTGILENSVKAADISAKAAQASVDGMISKERARIRVEITGVELDKGVANVTYAVTCFGPTSAFVIDAWATAETSPADVPLTMDLKFPMSLPPVLHDQELKKSAFIANKLKFETSDIEDFHKQRLYIHICGVISYKDVFDREHTTTFRYVCKTTDYVRPDGTISKYWFKSGPEEDNSGT
jgi:hypothetical protein